MLSCFKNFNKTNLLILSYSESCAYQVLNSGGDKGGAFLLVQASKFVSYARLYIRCIIKTVNYIAT